MSNVRSESLTVAIAAGKGGTGKTLVATSLALALSRHAGRGVELLDCDVEEPNAHLLLHPRIVHRSEVTMRVPQVNRSVCTRCGVCADTCEFSAIAVIRDAVLTFPDLCAGCGACTYACPHDAIIETDRKVGVVEKGVTDEGIDFYAGRTEVGQQRSGLVTRAVKREIHPDMVSILDAPPGTACPMQEAIEDADFCLLVTEPTPFGLSDLKLAVETCRELEVPCGIVLNRDGVGDSGVEGYCRNEGLPLLMRIPHARSIAAAYSRGEALVSAQPDWAPRFHELYEQIKARLGQRTG